MSGVFAQIVCDKDDFVWENGEVTHRIDWRHPRGEMYAVYSTVTFKDGSKQTDVMTKDEVEAIRKRSKAGQSGPWVTDFNEMAKKTVFRRVSKWITLSPEVADALDKDDDKNQPTTTNVEAQVTPAATPPHTQPPEQVEPRQVNYVKGIRGMIQIENISEGDLLAFGRDQQGWEESLGSLEEMAMAQPAKLQLAYENWAAIAKAIKAGAK